MTPETDTDFSAIRAELRAVARDLLGKRGQQKLADWRLFASSGWLGLDVPADLDGGDATFAEVAVIVEELGRAAADVPYLGGVVLGIGTLRLLAPGADRDELLRGAVSGATLLAAAVTAAGDGTREQPVFWLCHAGDGFRLRGSAAFVPDACHADRLLLLAFDPDGELVVVDTGPAACGIGVTEQPVLDSTRQFGLVAAENIAISRSSVWRFAGNPRTAVRRLADRAAVALACDSLGLAEAMLDRTVAYAQVREQFGRPIGSFQAVKHACADMLVQVTVARQLVSSAVTQLADADRGAGDDHAASVAASMAKSYACASAVKVVGTAMQLHGGIGYTWESGIHAYLKRALLNRSLFGSPTAHRKRLAERYRQPAQSEDFTVTG